MTTIDCVDGNVSLNGVAGGGGTIDARYKAVTLIKRATNSWTAVGAIGTIA